MRDVASTITIEPVVTRWNNRVSPLPAGSTSYDLLSGVGADARLSNYGCGIDNTTDAISRIKDWSGNDPDRFESVEDSRDIDDESNDINLTEFINNSNLDNMIMEVNSMNVNDKASVISAILGSWNTTPRQIQLATLLKMYGHRRRDVDNNSFTKDIDRLEEERIRIYHSKIDVPNDLENVFGEQHEICSQNNLGHSNELEMGSTEIERGRKKNTISPT